jgi:hypothetical protein
VTEPLTEQELAARFQPVLEELAERSRIADRFVDKDVYRIRVATLWTNVVLDPDDVGISSADLEPLHDVINRRIADVLGPQEDLKACFRYLTSRAGEQAMQAARLTQNHKDLLLYLASVILDPDGHRRWMSEISDRLER